MTEFLKIPPVWDAEGIEPPISKAKVGWKIDERPPADYMNYLQNKTYHAIRELQMNAVHKETISGMQTDVDTAKRSVEENAKQITNMQTDVDTAKKGTEENTNKIQEIAADVEYLKQNGGGGNGGGGFIFEDLIDGEPIGIKPPDNVTNLLVTNIQTTEITLTWDANKSNTVKDYRIYMGDVLISNTSSTTFTIRELTSATQYTFTVKTRDIYDIESAGKNINVSTL
ncbi:fibronectin type III domain-containing protein [Bacillus luti]|uniref:fibronectin type III domain-containing protein n=1 Tax=Bacillus luti TaxID=2026191 RepID=UPI003D65A331